MENTYKTVYLDTTKQAKLFKSGLPCFTIDGLIIRKVGFLLGQTTEKETVNVRASDQLKKRLKRNNEAREKREALKSLGLTCVRVNGKIYWE
jgi:hypothetical protein